MLDTCSSCFDQSQLWLSVSLIWYDFLTFEMVIAGHQEQSWEPNLFFHVCWEDILRRRSCSTLCQPIWLLWEGSPIYSFHITVNWVFWQLLVLSHQCFRHVKEIKLCSWTISLGLASHQQTSPYSSNFKYWHGTRCHEHDSFVDRHLGHCNCLDSKAKIFRTRLWAEISEF